MHSTRSWKESFRLLQPRRTRIPGERGMGISIFERGLQLHHTVFSRDMWIIPSEWCAIVRRGGRCPRLLKTESLGSDQPYADVYWTLKMFIRGDRSGM
jgi:hypothetical protein